MEFKRRDILTAAAATAAASATGLGMSAFAQQRKPLRLGVINDQTGMFAAAGGPGCVTAAKIAAAELGNAAAGMPVEILVADNKNNPDLTSSIVRDWFDNKGVDCVIDGGVSSSALAIQYLARERKKVYLISGPGTSDLTEKECAPFSFHFTRDTYTLARSTGLALTKEGGDSWFFITSDYAFGHALEADTGAFVKAGGGRVVGSVRHPLNTRDMSSFLLQAKASKAKIIGLANAGADTQNCIKQAAEFGITQAGQRLAALNMFESDVQSVGLDAAQGLYVTAPFYWDLNDGCRAFSTAFRREMPNVPTMVQAGTYSGVHHYLRGVQGAGTADPVAVSKWMRDNPVNDFYNENVKILRNGLVLHKIYLFEVKKPSVSRHKDDVYRMVSFVNGPEAHRKESDSVCPLLKT